MQESTTRKRKPSSRAPDLDNIEHLVENAIYVRTLHFLSAQRTSLQYTFCH